MFEDFINRLKAVQNFTDDPVALHAPVFIGNEKAYLLDAIDSTFVSSVGPYVDKFERMLEVKTGAARAVVCVNGTAALQVALYAAGVQSGDYVITQPISFVATANSIAHCGAKPVFVDIDAKNLGLSPQALRTFLEKNCRMVNGKCVLNGGTVSACVPVHTFGLPCAIEEIAAICAEWSIPLIEDAAEAMGSKYRGKSCGRFGKFGCFSFNGNKIATTGGGGAIITDDPEEGKYIKHITTTAKIPHRWKYSHDHVAWNFRMPNINAALGCAQLEMLDVFLEKKRWRASRYAYVIADSPWEFISEERGSFSNYWLCAILFNTHEEQAAFLEESNNSNFMTRPVWEPLPHLPMYKDCVCGDLPTAMDIASRLVNLPSGYGQ